MGFEMFLDTMSVLLLSTLSAAIAEGLGYVLVYRTESYKALSKAVDRQQKKVDKKKEATILSSKKEHRINRLEEDLKKTNRDIQQLTFRSTFVVGFVLIAFFAIMSSVYEGKVVAKLPFEPFSMVTPLSHRSLLGNNMTDCSAFFLYALCSVSIRQMLQRYMGYSKQLKGQDFMSMLMNPTPQQ